MPPHSPRLATLLVASPERTSLRWLRPAMGWAEVVVQAELPRRRHWRGGAPARPCGADLQDQEHALAMAWLEKHRLERITRLGPRAHPRRFASAVVPGKQMWIGGRHVGRERGKREDDMRALQGSVLGAFWPI
jgi:hypothetical protein